MRLLLVDDDSKNFVSLKSFLEEEAFAVDHVVDPSKGIFLSKTNSYDIILINQSRKHGFGPNICSQLRRAGSEVPVIGISHGKSVDERLDFFQAGADDCLSQPYLFQELLARLRAVLRRGSALRTEV